MGRYRRIGYRKRRNGWRIAGIVLHLILGALYLFAVVWHLFLYNEQYAPATGEMQWMPFVALAELIEPAVLGNGTWQPVIWYVATRLLVYVPFGYFTGVLFDRKLWFLRFPLLILAPIAVEAAQWRWMLGRTDMDDVIFGMIGGLLGAMLHSLLAACFGLRRARSDGRLVRGI